MKRRYLIQLGILCASSLTIATAAAKAEAENLPVIDISKHQSVISTRFTLAELDPLAKEEDARSKDR